MRTAILLINHVGDTHSRYGCESLPKDIRTKRPYEFHLSKLAQTLIRDTEELALERLLSKWSRSPLQDQ